MILQHTNLSHDLKSDSFRSSSIQGFTLIELMIVVVIVALLFSIAIPSYTNYIQKNNQLMAQHQGLYLADQLHRWRVKHLTYAGFSVGDHQQQIEQDKYSIVLMDATGDLPLTDAKANSQGWIILIEPKPDYNPSKPAKHYYLDSLGRRCVFDIDSPYAKVNATISASGTCEKGW